LDQWVARSRVDLNEVEVSFKAHTHANGSHTGSCPNGLSVVDWIGLAGNGLRNGLA